MQVPEQVPRELAPDAFRNMKKAHGFWLLFGRIWMSVGGGVSLVFAVLTAVLHPGWILGVIIGLPFLIAGFLLTGVARRRVERDRALLEHGVLVSGEVVEVVVDKRLRKNKQFSIRITCRYIDPDSQREYDAVLGTWDRALVANHPVGRTVPMLIDPTSGKAVAPTLVQVHFVGSKPPSARVVKM